MDRRRIDMIAMGAIALIGAMAFIHLHALPIFEDEGTEIRWIWRAIDAGEWLQPLADGKPLQVWTMTPFFVAGLHPLSVMRALNVLCGMTGSVLLYRVALRAAEHRVAAFASAVLFALCPFAVYLQRLAVAETFLSTAGILVFLCVLRFIDSPVRSRALQLAAALVLAAFCKFPVGFTFVASLPLALVLLPDKQRSVFVHPPLRREIFVALAPVILLAAAVAIVVTVQLLSGRSPGFGFGLIKIVGGNELDIAAVIGVPPMNLLTELTAQLSWPVTIIGAIGIAAGVFLGDWRARWLTASGLLPMFAIALLPKFWEPRYLLFTLAPLAVAATTGWSVLLQRAATWRKYLSAVLLVTCVTVLGIQSLQIVSDPIAARWSPLDRLQYFEGTSSGYGYSEAANFLLESPNPPTIFALDGHSAYQLLNYLPPEWKQRVRPIVYASGGAHLRTEAERLNNLLGGGPAWIVVPPQLLSRFLESNLGKANLDKFGVRELAEFDKPGKRNQLALYEIVPH